MSMSVSSSHGWEKGEKPDGNSKIDLTLALNQNNEALLEQLLLEVSDPKSSKYGKHLTNEELGDLVRNSEGAVKTKEYLLAAGVNEDDIKINGHETTVHVSLPVSLAESLFAADFAYYSHSEISGRVLKTESATVPEELRNHVSHLPHISYFPTPKPPRVKHGHDNVSRDSA
eukprot:TRINITY_DN1897_c0_g1_i2.p1 TRINITY_DN1897_c0_g1~~TRINITY_DN1897_c0_g1_i2.p1  ORF type:complete len:172 (+),score=44.54 TRINITY_DN1897_c0_g1_i2:1683-2198(+)